jgi:PAS domain S-box-containing protein
VLGKLKLTMKNYRLFNEVNRHLVIILATVFVILGVALLIVHLHRQNKMEILSQFQDHQLVHAQHLAHQIEFFFRARSEELQALSSLVSREYGDLGKNKADIEIYSKMIKDVKVLSLYNGSGAIVYTTDSKRIDLDHSDREFFSWAKKKGSKGKVFGLPLVQPDSFMFLLVVPIYQDSPYANHPKPSGKFVGVLTLTVDLKEFFNNQFHFLGLGKNLHQVWIMDTGGELLFQFEHKEMVHRNIYQKDESCQRCHTSFDYAKKILKEKEGTAHYKLKGFPERVAAFAPMNFEDMSWIVAVNSAYDDVAALTKKSLRNHLVLLGILVFAFILGSASVIRTDRLKVRAEEEAKRWREKRILEDKIQQSEALYHTIVENAHDAIWTLDTQGNITFVNRSGEEISGYKASELVGKNFTPFVHPEDLPKVKDLILDTFQGRFHNFEVRFSAKDGEIHVISVNSVPLYENSSLIGLFSIGRDITERREAEEALRESEKQLRHLSSQLLTAQEKERRRISRELHDELGGSLAVLKLRCSLIEKNLQKDETVVREECKQNVQYIDQIIENVGRLSRGLSPSILEDLGLSAALPRLIDNFVKNYNIKVASDIIDVDHLFPKDAQIMIYRVFQEALTNIGKHAQARNVFVKVKKVEGRISFFAEDDGKGFDVKHAAMKEGSERGLGLATMDERARMLGGSFDLWSEEGRGTRITLIIPIKKGGSL